MAKASSIYNASIIGKLNFAKSTFHKGIDILEAILKILLNLRTMIVLSNYVINVKIKAMNLNRMHNVNVSDNMCKNQQESYLHA